MIKKLIVVTFVFLFSMLCAVGSYSYNQLDKPIELNSDQQVYHVQKGSSLKKVLNDFAAKGWIQTPRIYEYWFRYNQMTGIQQGEYELNSGDTMNDIVQKFIRGAKILRTVQLIEGKTFQDYLVVLEKNEHIEHTLKGLTKEQITQLISTDIDYYEGWFFPDTYLFESGTTDVEILQLAYERMKKVLAEQWALKSSDSVVSTPYEALILASIIEKETGFAPERPQISGVFSRRLKIDMRLQTDPTVIYGVGDDFDGNLTRTHLRTDTPYNTYTRKGLPPTPIANPGKEAIFAAVNPAEGKSLFFVAKGDGTHQFSTTLQEHNNAVKHYQRFRRRDDYQSTPSTEVTAQ